MAEMTDQVKAVMIHLKEGGTYLFDHKRKGPFVGVYRGFKPTRPSDIQDDMLLEVDVYTEDGSGQERLANAFERDENGRKMRPVYSKKLLRPSLLNTISSPSSTVHQQLLEALTTQRKRGEEKAKALGQEEPILSTISLPTAKAMNYLKKSTALPVKRSLLQKIFGKD